MEGRRRGEERVHIQLTLQFVARKPEWERRAPVSL